MRKLVKVAGAVTILNLLAAGLVLAQSQPLPITVPPSTLTTGTESTLYTIITRIAGFLFWIIFLLAVVFILIAAFLYVTSGGNEDRVKSAKNYLVYAAVAMAVALLARVIPGLIVDIIQ